MPKSTRQLAKLTLPRLHKAVARARVLALLNEAREDNLLICMIGPPGAGKTTIVATWLDTRGSEGIRHHIDAGAADPANFFYYLGEAAKPYSRKAQRHAARRHRTVCRHQGQGQVQLRRRN